MNYDSTLPEMMDALLNISEVVAIAGISIILFLVSLLLNKAAKKEKIPL
ncbi:hypothetical protein G3570_11980 [Balneolaceae bacterium YR4-1]|uniref:Uncharacterized protein n=1 Tax=Halalkalibaculum roseum TaxID=2709311 RepID=A0A6M1T3P1_9BACT|nr:hypothetical protein [Halalkalibaculum roseum]NGP77357.1 hypothetical protein [Halalkalibaculum roseum]